MQLVKLSKIESSLGIILPASIVEILHLHENDEIIVEVVDNRIVLTPASLDFQDAWSAYQTIEQNYRNANRKLAE